MQQYSFMSLTFLLTQVIESSCSPADDEAKFSTVQAAIRAFIVDNAPTHQQEDASAWAGRITGFGSILGYLSGYVDLPRIMPFFGNTQFKVLCVIAALSLWITVAISCSYIKEADPRLEGPAKNTKLGIVSFFRSVSSSLVRLPPQTRMVCEVQFFSWMGWFPFLFYVTTYIGQLYVNPIFEESPDLDPGEIDKAWEKATRVGSFALFVFAITSFAANLLLPFLIAPTYKPPKLRHSSTSQTNIRFSRLLRLFQIPWLTIRRAWLLAHLTYALCMALTFFISTPVTATLLTGLVGLPWGKIKAWLPCLELHIFPYHNPRRAYHQRVMLLSAFLIMCEMANSIFVYSIDTVGTFCTYIS